MTDREEIDRAFYDAQLTGIGWLMITPDKVQHVPANAVTLRVPAPAVQGTLKAE